VNCNYFRKLQKATFSGGFLTVLQFCITKGCKSLFFEFNTIYLTLLRNCPGVTPFNALKRAIKWLVEAKPQEYAISVTLLSLEIISLSASLRRNKVT
jgi:hypothetical protein